MKTITLLTLSAALALTACAGKNTNTAIFGKVNIIDENGQDITHSCSSNINANGLLVQSAIKGTNTLKQITCTPGHYIYRIKPAADVTVNVPAENMAVYFGDITIALDSNGYSVKNNGTNSAGLYNGSLPVKPGSIKVGTAEKDWVKNVSSTGF